MGNLKETYDAYEPLELGDWRKFGYEKGGDDVSLVFLSLFVLPSPSTESDVSSLPVLRCMKAIGKYLVDVIKRNPQTFRIFSPDELASNKLDGVFEVTDRDFQWDPLTAHNGGRVTEMLSEHTLQGWMQGESTTADRTFSNRC